MYIKLDNDTWEKYINEYFSLENKISIKQFCKDRNINPSQFFYHRKRIANVNKPVVLQEILHSFLLASFTELTVTIIWAIIAK